jgi:hypothetical protein
VKRKSQSAVKDGVKCKVTAGTHAGKAGIVSDINTSKTGHVTITVTQKMGRDSKPWRKISSQRDKVPNQTTQPTVGLPEASLFGNKKQVYCHTVADFVLVRP